MLLYRDRYAEFESALSVQLRNGVRLTRHIRSAHADGVVGYFSSSMDASLTFSNGLVQLYGVAGRKKR